MSLFKPDWERTLKILYAVGETLATGSVPTKGLNDADQKTVKLTAAAFEHAIRGVVSVVRRYRE